MLDNPSGYEFIDVSDVGHYIDGKFIPTVNPKSATALLYYEAYLFMLEAWYERMNVDGIGTRSISPPTAPTLLKSSLRGIPLYSSSVGSANYSAIRGPLLDKAAGWLCYVSQDTTVGDGFVEWYSSSPKRDVDSMLSGYALNAWENDQPYYSMVGDWRLLSEFIRCKLWELNSMRKAIFKVKMSSFCTSATMQFLKADGSIRRE